MQHLKAMIMASLMLAGCDYVSEPIPPQNGGGEGPGEGPVQRRAFLEEFTGHRCNTCPAAHAVAAQLENLYGDQLVLVAIHATQTFAAPLNPPAADGRYSTDFRTAAGNTYTTTFGVTFLPTGMVNRRPYNSSITMSQGTWGAAISEVIAEPAKFDLAFRTIEHDADANTVTTEVDVVPIAPEAGNYALTLYVVEDHVTDWQMNNAASPPDVPDYDHRHVLRANVNGTWGTALDLSAAVNDTLTLSFENSPLDPSWNAEHLYLVAYVFNTASNEVLQVVERKIHP